MTTTKAIAVKPESMTQLAALADTAKKAITGARSFKVADLAGREKALAMIRALKDRAALVEALKNELVKPQKKLLDGLTKKFTGPIKDYQIAEDALKGAILAFDRAEEARKAAAALEAANAAKAGDAEAAHEALMIAAAPPERAEGAYETKRWAAKVIDPAAVPRQFLVVDERALVAHAKATNGAAVPGVVFEQVSSLTVRS